MTFEQISELVELVAQRRLARFELENADFHLTIEGQAASQPAAVELVAAPQALQPAAPRAAAAPAEPTTPSPSQPGLHILHSPIVGTYYRCPAPDAPPFVEVGSRVSKGQVLCIVEAMKLMNEIESDLDGVVVEIYPSDAQPVEYGEPLFGIRPA
ncbi:MAG: acetyl-CoA carboxylase biotin carboxyl carrier protein [Thermoanaerobaculia bacterium]